MYFFMVVDWYRVGIFTYECNYLKNIREAPNLKQ